MFRQVTAPSDLESALSDPLHALLYMCFMVLSCGALSYSWIGVSGSNVKEEVEKMQNEGMYIEGSRATSQNQTDHYAKWYFNQYIPTAALLGGMAIGAPRGHPPVYSLSHCLPAGVLTIVADFMGAIGSGTGLLLAVTTIYEYYEIVRSETGNDFSKVWRK
jgi:protein transport protein SEC61 subunit alpha